LAGLDGELGSILQESLGGTAAESIITTVILDLSWLGSICVVAWEVAECTSSLGWELGSSSVFSLECGHLSSEARIIGLLRGESVLSDMESSNLACISGGDESCFGNLHGSLGGEIGLDGIIVCLLEWLQDIVLPVPSFVMELLLFQN
jgi:hypothetical protein